jgi:hypothetical protein
MQSCDCRMAGQWTGSSRLSTRLQPASAALAVWKQESPRLAQVPAEALMGQVPRPMTSPPRSEAATPAPDSRAH